ncbi:uncharacterized protein LOC141692628 [Apium graveolens]|uniref:uncharacterized protein LOC141692628 n=1 Tax=Apium graveolens TaxID=4045 RepID=UPI003D7AC39A
MAALSLNSLVCFTSSLANYHNTSRIDIGASAQNVTHLVCHPRVVGLRIKLKRLEPFVLFASGDNIAVETSDKGSRNAEASLSDNQPSTENLPSSNTSEDSQSLDSQSQASKDSNGSAVTSEQKEGNSPANLRSTPIRSSRLTAREKLRAARVLGRKPEPKKAPKLQLGSQVLETLRESDKGKRRPGLPEAPTNMLDDSKRGMPKKGLTFELPGGNEVFFIILSVVLISTVMFTTTYVVWKVGAIHFNEN